MERIVILGNSGSGKSSLAKALSRVHGAAHLDLDVIAWEAERRGVRAPFEQSERALLSFIEGAEAWVVEGCYSSLLGVAAAHCAGMIFLNPGVAACVGNCEARPREPHKYPSREAQDANLRVLVEWVKEYETRDGEFSLREHRRLFDAHAGRKVEYSSNEEAQRRAASGVPPRVGKQG